MQIENRLNNHYRRWNIALDPEEQFSKFKNRLVDIINRNLGTYIARNLDTDSQFKEILDLNKANKPSVKKSRPIYKESHPMNSHILDGTIKSIQPDSYTEREFGDTHIYNCVASCNNLRELATVLQIAFWALETHYDDIKEKLSKTAKEIKRISILTPSANFAIHKKGKQLIIYPSGDQFLSR